MPAAKKEEPAKKLTKEEKAAAAAAAAAEAAALAAAEAAALAARLAAEKAARQATWSANRTSELSVLGEQMESWLSAYSGRTGAAPLLPCALPAFSSARRPAHLRTRPPVSPYDVPPATAPLSRYCEVSCAGDERSLCSYVSFCGDAAGEPSLSPSPLSVQNVTNNARRAAGLAIPIQPSLESSRAGSGALKEVAEWLASISTVAADVGRVLADAREVAAASAAEAAAADLVRQPPVAENGASAEVPPSALSDFAAAARAAAKVANLRVAALESNLNELANAAEAARDLSTAALLDVAEDYAGEAKGGSKELLCCDAAYTYSVARASASRAAPRLPQSVFSRARPAGDVIIWSSLTGQKSVRARVISNASTSVAGVIPIEAEIPKSVLGIVANCAVRISANFCDEHAPPTATTVTAPVKVVPVARRVAVDAVQAESKEGKESEEKAESKEEVTEAPASADAANALPEADAAASGGGSTEAPLPAPSTQTPAPPATPLRAVGGWINVELIATMPPSSTTGKRGWAFSAGGTGRSDRDVLRKLEHPAERNAAAAAGGAVRVRWTLPPHVVAVSVATGSPRDAVPARWDPAARAWTSNGVTEPSFTPSTRTLQLLAARFTPHALALPFAADLPYANWALTPTRTPAGVPCDMAVFRVVTARGLKVAIHVDAHGCALISPRVEALEYLTGAIADADEDGDTPALSAPRLPPGQLLALLDSSGVRLLPADSDAAAANALVALESASARLGSRAALEAATKTGSRAERAAAADALAASDGATSQLSEPPPPTLAPLLPPRIEAALALDLSRVAPVFALSSVPARGYVAAVPPADPTDAPPNAGAAVWAQVSALETVPLRERAVPEGGGASTRAWAALQTATLRVRVTDDADVPRGFVVTAAPEGVSPQTFEKTFAGLGAYVAIDEALLAQASTEARERARVTAPSFVETLRRLLVLVRPFSFTA